MNDARRRFNRGRAGTAFDNGPTGPQEIATEEIAGLGSNFETVNLLYHNFELQGI